ncbi:MAG: hypothetical protein EOP47_19395 [Sphingobacteriaceae bacterium]|nr:MAG: hypothetical protein EOP47_19395 [Sphingobacteriaceae bacterium]
MKKIIYILLLIPFIAISCKKEKKKENPIIGKWYTQKTVTKVYVGGSSTPSTSTEENFSANDWYEFRANGTYSSSGRPAGEQSATYSVNSSANTITLKTSTGDVTGVIKTLTTSNLALYTESTYLGDKATLDVTFARTVKER